ncbi:MAG: M20/M25/M40 family metallo-hydrolase, partial [Bacilli bacterium]
PLINDDAMSDFAATSIGKIIGPSNVIELPYPTMGGEDFAFLAQEVPSSFFFVGIAQENKPEPVHHHPNFAWEDEVLIESSAYLAQIAFDFLTE